MHPTHFFPTPHLLCFFIRLYALGVRFILFVGSAHRQFTLIGCCCGSQSKELLVFVGSDGEQVFVDGEAKVTHEHLIEVLGKD